MSAAWLRRTVFLLRQTLRPQLRQQELDEELRFHLEQAEEAHRAAGLSACEAHRRAQIEFGGLERAREQCHSQRPGWRLETVLQDVRYAVRGFLRQPVFTLTAILTLALGIGATTAVFSVVDRILFRSLPYAHSDRLVSAGVVQSLEVQEFMLGGFYYQWQDKQTPFEAMAAQGTMLHPCDLVENNPVQLNCIHAQRGFLPLLGISPVLGRNFLPEEDRPNGPRVALISYGLWNDRFHRDPGILNRLINVDGTDVRMIGVLPKGFELPTLQAPDLLLPMALNEGQERAAIPGTPMRVFARLRPGVNLEQAKASLDPLFAQYQQHVLPPRIRKDFHLSVRSLRARETSDIRLAAWILFAAVLAVLLIACANVASLTMARSQARAGDQAMRLALGASRGRLIQQALTEACLLSLCGAALGMALAVGLLHIFVQLAPTGVAFLNHATLDLRIAGFTVLLALVCGLFFGILPALQQPSAAALTTHATPSSQKTLLRRGLVVAQIAVCLVLLSSSALLLRSFSRMQNQQLGMQADSVLTARVALPSFRYDTAQKKMEFYLRAEESMKRLPGVRSIAITDSVPPGGWNNGGRFSELGVEGKPPMAPGTGGSIVTRLVTPGYFAALRIPIVRGRGFTEQDRGSSEQSVILSRLLASRLFPGEDPLGQKMRIAHDGPWVTVVGVAEDVKNNGLTAANAPELYTLRRNLAPDWSGPTPVLLIDSALPPANLAPWLRAQISALDPTVPVQTETLRLTVSKLADQPRFETALLGFFALCGLMMALIGLYGIVAFLAVQRTREIGVRMALGATRPAILRLMAQEGLRLLGLGILLGLLAALAAAQLLKSLLFGVALYDPAAWAATVLVLALAATVATLFPALRATKVEPVVALRYE
jgi:predicted permease